jgi:transcription initiation factor IIF auxiliary subunit
MGRVFFFFFHFLCVSWADQTHTAAVKGAMESLASSLSQMSASQEASADERNNNLALMQALSSMDLNQKLGVDGTQQGTDLNATITRIVQEMESNVISKITAGHTTTQAAVTAAHEKLVEKSQAAANALKTAKAGAEAYFNCFLEEQAILGQYWEEDAKLKQMESTSRELCAIAARHAVIDEATGVHPYACDIEVDTEDGCRNLAEAAQAELAVDQHNVKHKIREQIKVYTAASAKCTEASRNVSMQFSVRGGYDEQWRQKRYACGFESVEDMQDECRFAEAEKHKCSEIEKWQALLADVNGKGHKHSDADRHDEYATTRKTVCLLKSMVDPSLDCSGAFHLSDAVGEPLDLYTDETKDIACTTSGILFRAEHWHRPEVDEKSEELPRGDDYWKEAAKPQTLEELSKSCK